MNRHPLGKLKIKIMFKDKFKYYKSKWPVPDFKDVIDFRKESICDKVQEVQLNEDCWSLGLPLGINPIHKWRLFSLVEYPGLIIIRNAFNTNGQRYWVARSLKEYPKQPNRVNLNDRLFNKTVLDDWWSSLQQCDDKDEARRMKISMRWTTLGYHHDWNTKIYCDELYSEFPEDLARMTIFFANVLGYDCYKAQAAIVNYYPIGTTLAAHTDHSEQNLEAPLFSFSFGQTAIFLIGGHTREESPSALFLESGDVLVMSQQSRLCYHAVPRVMKSREETWNFSTPKAKQTQEPVRESLQPSKKLRTDINHCNDNEMEIALLWSMDPLLYHQVSDELYWLPFKNYLYDSRININVRQVLNNLQQSLNS